MQTTTNQNTHDLARQCQNALSEVAFPDLKTRQLFEGLIKNAAQTADAAAKLLGGQN